MVQIGNLNQLKVLHEVEFGFYLDGGQDGEILLPRRYVTDSVQTGNVIEVFICFDSEDRLIAMTDTPLGVVGEFAFLKVVAVEKVGAFLDWGLPKDLFLPFAEQTQPVRIGQSVVVFIYLDKTDRIAASMRIERHLEKGQGTLKEAQKVELLIARKTDLGFKAIINGAHIGVLYDDEIFKPLREGTRIVGYIKKLREDGKIDLSLQQTGHRAAQGLEPKILELLKQKGGTVDINDKTSAERIHDLFGVSKKQYKIALGALYKKRLILVEPTGISLVKLTAPQPKS